MRKLNLLIGARKIDGKYQIATKGNLENFDKIELIGIYEFLKNKANKEERARIISLKVIINDKGIITNQEVYKGDVPTTLIYETLKQEEIKKINLKFGIRRKDGKRRI